MSDVVSRLTTARSRSYRFDRELGQGGMATVYLAREPHHCRAAANGTLFSVMPVVQGQSLRDRLDAAVNHPRVDRRTPREAGVVIVRLDRVFRAVGYSNGLIVGTILS